MKTKRVLILDDSEIVTTLTAFIVDRLGYESIQFTDGESTLAYIENPENPYPELIISDHSLTSPGSIRKTAFKLLSKLKTFGYDIPVIMASGNCNSDVKDKYLKLGVKSYVYKDDENYIDTLSEEIKNILNKDNDDDPHNSKPDINHIY